MKVYEGSRIPRVLQITALGLVLAVSFGFNFGVSTQNTYLVHGLSIVDPSLYSRDWFVSECTDYHPAFTWLSATLLYFDSSGWILAVLNIFVIMISFMTAVAILDSIFGRETPYWILVCLTALLTATQTSSVGGSYIQSWVLQPSAIASMFFLGMIVAYVRGKFVVSGLALAISGAFHVNFLLLGMTVLLVTHLLVSRERIWGRLATLILPAGVLILFVPILLDAAASDNSSLARTILFDIRSPHHYLPTNFSPEFIPFLGFQLLALGGCWLNRSRSSQYSRALSILISMAALVWLATALTTLVFVPQVAQIYAYRLAPFCDLLCILLIFRNYDSLNLLQRFDAKWLLLLSVVVIVSNISAYYWLRSPGLGPWLILLVGLIIFLSSVTLEGSVNRAIVGLAKLLPAQVILLMALTTLLATYNATLSSNLLGPKNESSEEFYQWTQTTEKDALYLVPPDLGNFRLRSRRAIVVDWKSNPAVPDELVEWYRRIDLISGQCRPRDLKSAVEGYNEISKEQLDSVISRFGVDFVIVTGKGDRNWGSSFPIAFKNATYTAFATSPGETRSRVR